MCDPGLSILAGALVCGLLAWLVRPERRGLEIAVAGGVGGVLGAVLSGLFRCS